MMLLRGRVSTAFRDFSLFGKVKKSAEYGINYDKIIEYLGKCPGEREDYHIDHIFPISIFNFDNEIEIKIAFCPENHQWLKKEENLSKNDKYNKEEFEKFYNIMFEKFSGFKR